MMFLFLIFAAAHGEDRTQLREPKGNSDFDVVAWPEADELFHRDPQWLGGDDAGSIDLGKGRVAWFFGDSFVAPTIPNQRRGSTMVHNCIGIQTGYDPTQAKFKTYWRHSDGKATSFIADEDQDFFWPGGSRLVDGKLLVFLMRARTAETGLKFKSTGWGAVIIDNPDADPDRWTIRKLSAPPNPFKVLVGSASVLLEGEHLIALSVADDTHDVFLVRWRASDAAAGDLSRPKWWTGEPAGWVNQQNVKQLPPPLFRPGQTEFTVHQTLSTREYIQIQFKGFPRTPIGVRRSARLTGPWSRLAELFRPPEIDAHDASVMCYAAKAHPEQQGGGLALTYCTNTFQWPQLFDNQLIYYPRFLKISSSFDGKR
jgi:hypothetical protein